MSIPKSCSINNMFVYMQAFFKCERTPIDLTLDLSSNFEFSAMQTESSTSKIVQPYRDLTLF